MCDSAVECVQKSVRPWLCQVNGWRLKGLVVLEILLDYKYTRVYPSLGSCTICLSPWKKASKSTVQCSEHYPLIGARDIILRHASWENSSSLHVHFPPGFWHKWLHPLLLQSDAAFPLLFLTSFHLLCVYFPVTGSLKSAINTALQRAGTWGGTDGYLHPPFTQTCSACPSPVLFSAISTLFWQHFFSSPGSFFTPPLTRASWSGFS